MRATRQQALRTAGHEASPAHAPPHRYTRMDKQAHTHLRSVQLPVGSSGCGTLLSAGRCFSSSGALSGWGGCGGAGDRFKNTSPGPNPSSGSPVTVRTSSPVLCTGSCETDSQNDETRQYPPDFTDLHSADTHTPLQERYNRLQSDACQRHTHTCIFQSVCAVKVHNSAVGEGVMRVQARAHHTAVRVVELGR